MRKAATKRLRDMAGTNEERPEAMVLDHEGDRQNHVL